MHPLAERIKQLIPMREAFEHYGMEINRAGFCVCPFHAEKTASLKIYPSSFYCFGCGAGGDVIRFVQLLYKLDFKAALLRIGFDFGLSVSVPSAEEEKRIRKANEERKERKRAEDRLNEKRKKYLEMRCALWTKQKAVPLTENERIKLNVLDDWLDKNP